MGGDFYADGRLQTFRMPLRNKKGFMRESGLHFMEDRKLDRYWFVPKETNP